jgi:hypothetical protein
MPYTLFVTPAATDDIAVAVAYYNTLSVDLGLSFCRPAG